MKIPTAKKLPSGSWNCYLRIGGQQISVTEATEELCIAKAMAYKAGLIKAKKAPESITLREACTRYIDGRRARRSPTTIQGYEKIRKYYLQGIMDKKLDKLTSSMIDRAIEAECARTSNRGRPISPKTVHNAYLFIASVLRQYAPDLERSVGLPEVKRKIPQMIPIEVLLPVIKGTSIELPCLLAAWLSLSMSEIRGLTKSKSIRYGKLYVVETVVDIKGKPIKKEGGKEEERTRAFDIPPYIQELIDRVDGDVLVPESGAVIYNRFVRLLKKAGLPHMPFHGLRHLNASVMAMLGIDAKTAQERGGWKTDRTMKEVYTHTFDAQRSAADQKINAYFQSVIQPNADENADA